MSKHLLLLLLVVQGPEILAQSVPSEYYQALQYRLIGPFRASRTVGAVGIPSQPNVFYIGVNNGGVWKTDDYGRTWNAIFDDAPTGSVGDIAVSPAQPNIIYVGSGEGLHRPDLGVGDGIFKSVDGGNTWNHIGLADIQQVARIIVHPENPNVVLVAGLGHPYGANEMRGVFKTVDGGENWENVLFINHNTGAAQVEFDPQNPDVIYADMWEHQEGPWENAKFSGPNSGLYKSVDQGATWNKLSNGLPTADEGLGRIGIAIAPSNPDRLYATVDARDKGGVYRSDDGGANWTLVHTNNRVWGRAGDFAELKVHPDNPDVVFSGNIAAYKSTDGGYNWHAIKGAPGGDDYHRIWINPIQPDIMLFAADQGAVITVNGGKTWSSWYNQPTAQLYHVTTDNQFPYWVYGGQQESGAIGIASRGNGGQISFRDWMGVGADEYAYIAPDPKDPDIIYGGRVIRFNKKTGQSQNVAPEILRSGDVRFLRTMPLMFHPANDEMLLFGTNILWKTMNGGQSWEKISPDLTRKQPEIPASVGDFKTLDMESMPQRAIIYALAPSSLNEQIIWAGTDDGLVHLTTDGGKNWKDVTPTELSAWDKISQIDAGHFDEQTAYIAVNAIRKDNMQPLIYRTTDFGQNWDLVVNGLPEIGPINVVREDNKQAGLVFAGSERAVYFSIDQGAHWQPLRQNMPATSIRDLVVHDNDLVIGTHGRSIWILDNISPLRALKQSIRTEQAALVQPTKAIRVRDNMFSDTPLPPEEPTGENPVPGIAIDYYLPNAVNGVMIQIIGKDEAVIAEFSSADAPEQIDTTRLPHPTYWMQSKQLISTSKGHHRYYWNLRYPNPRGAQRSFSISAVKDRTPSGPMGPYVSPGAYKIRLIVDGQAMEQDLFVELDPRVKMTDQALTLQGDLSKICYDDYHQIQSLREEVDRQLAQEANLSDEIIQWRGQGDPGNGDILYGSIYESSLEAETAVGLQEKLLYLLLVLQSADAQPTEATIASVDQLHNRVIQMIERYNALNGN